MAHATTGSGLGEPRRSALDSVRIYPSLTRTILIGGVERRAMIPLVGLCAYLLLGFGWNPITPALAALLAFGVLPFLRRRNQQDPQWLEVLSEHVQVAGFYPGQARFSETRERLSTF